jgi:hypothetical protein
MAHNLFRRLVDPVGNKTFRDKVYAALDEYLKADTRFERLLVVRKVVDRVSAEGGRFLKKDNREGRWFALIEQRSKEKVGHALRDAANLYEARLRERFNENVTWGPAQPVQLPGFIIESSQLSEWRQQHPHLQQCEHARRVRNEIRNAEQDAFLAAIDAALGPLQCAPDAFPLLEAYDERSMFVFGPSVARKLLEERTGVASRNVAGLPFDTAPLQQEDSTPYHSGSSVSIEHVGGSTSPSNFSLWSWFRLKWSCVVACCNITKQFSLYTGHTMFGRSDKNPRAAAPPKSVCDAMSEYPRYSGRTRQGSFT